MPNFRVRNQQDKDDVEYCIRLLKREAAYGISLANLFLLLSDDFGKAMDSIDWVLRSFMPKTRIRTNPEELRIEFRRLETAGVIQPVQMEGGYIQVRDSPSRYHLEPKIVETWGLTDLGRKVLLRLSDEESKRLQPEPIEVEAEGLMWTRGFPVGIDPRSTVATAQPECPEHRIRVAFRAKVGGVRSLEANDMAEFGSLFCPGPNDELSHDIPWFTKSETFAQVQNIAERRIKDRLRQQRS